MKYTKELKNYAELNKVAKDHCIVLLGADFAGSIPVSELKQSLAFDSPVYNRSLNGLTLKDAAGLTGVCAADLRPDQVLVNLGETELRGGMSIPQILSDYETLIAELKNSVKKKTRITIVSVAESACPGAAEFNEALYEFAKELRLDFVNINEDKESENSKVGTFELLRRYFYTQFPCHRPPLLLGY